MHDDTVTTSWKRLTDKVKSLWSDPAEDAGAQTSGTALGHEVGGTGAPGKPPTAAPPAAPHGDREEDRQAAPLATWEDEGGRPSRSAQAPLRKV